MAATVRPSNNSSSRQFINLIEFNSRGISTPQLRHEKNGKIDTRSGGKEGGRRGGGAGGRGRGTGQKK